MVELFRWLELFWLLILHGYLLVVSWEIQNDILDTWSHREKYRWIFWILGQIVRNTDGYFGYLVKSWEIQMDILDTWSHREKYRMISLAWQSSCLEQADLSCWQNNDHQFWLVQQHDVQHDDSARLCHTLWCSRDVTEFWEPRSTGFHQVPM